MSNNEQLIKNLYSSLEEPIFLGDRITEGQFGVLLAPGQFVDPNIVESDSTDDMQGQAELCDDRLNTSFLYQTLPGTISDGYGELLEFAALPRTSLSPSENAELQQIRSWMDSHEGDYTYYSDRYYDAQDAYEAERRSQAPSGSKLQRLNRRRDDALDSWERRGFKRDWENRQARLSQMLAGNPEAHWQDLRRRFVDQRRTSPNRGDYMQTFLKPAVRDWPNASWTSFEASVHDREMTSRSRATSWSGGMRIGWGLWSFGGGAGGSSESQYSRSEVSDIDVEFEYLRVRIDRPWLRSAVFSQRFWTWKKGHGFSTISDGGDIRSSPPTRPVGNMPVLSTHLIVVRNVVLRAAFSENERSMTASQFSARASFGWGPFRVGGSYSRSTRDEYVHAHEEDRTIRIPQPQIIAVTGMLLPRSPDPDRTLPWGDDAAFETPSPTPLPGPAPMGFAPIAHSRPLGPGRALPEDIVRSERRADLQRLRNEAHEASIAKR